MPSHKIGKRIPEQMHPNLVLPSRMWPCLYHGVPLECFENSVLGDRDLPLLPVHFHRSRLFVLRKRKVDRSLALFRRADGDCLVVFFDAAALELRASSCMGLRCLGKDDDAARFFIETMHDKNVAHLFVQD